MNRNLIIGAGFLSLVAIVALVASATRRHQSPTTQQTGPEWKLVVNLPKTNSNAPSSTPVPKAN